MLYKISTVSEIQSLTSTFPQAVLEKLYSYTVTLDEAYGAGRNPDITGGYTILAETKEDLILIENVEVQTDIFEWVDYIPSEPAYCAALYLRGDDYSIVVICPVAIAPQAMLDELEY